MDKDFYEIKLPSLSCSSFSPLHVMHSKFRCNDVHQSHSSLFLLSTFLIIHIFSAAVCCFWPLLRREWVGPSNSFQSHLLFHTDSSSFCSSLLFVRRAMKIIWLVILFCGSLASSILFIDFLALLFSFYWCFSLVWLFTFFIFYFTYTCYGLSFGANHLNVIKTPSHCSTHKYTHAKKIK